MFSTLYFGVASRPQWRTKMVQQTASNTIGPFFHHVITPKGYKQKGIVDNNMVGKNTRGERIKVAGQIIGSNGKPLRAAMLEIWQANSVGRYKSLIDDRNELRLDKDFSGFGRVAAENKGKFEFQTIKPGQVPSIGNTLQAPHINLVLFAAAMDSHLFTRLYFSDEIRSNDLDPVLTSVPEDRRDTLIAIRKKSQRGTSYRFDIKLGGDEETVFFDV